MSMALVVRMSLLEPDPADDSAQCIRILDQGRESRLTSIHMLLVLQC